MSDHMAFIDCGENLEKISCPVCSTNFPCGFASSLICIFNPEQSLDDEIIDAIENIFGVGIRIVEAHI